MIQVGGFVLAGGRSSRMGRDKALLELDGEALAARVVRSLKEVCAEVAIAGGGAELAPFGRVIPDGVAGRGPLAGIVAALSQSRWEWNLFCPVDVPFVPRSAWERVLARVEQGGAAVIMARVQGQVQPLCAAYSAEVLSGLSEFLETGRGKVAAAAEAAGVIGYVDFEETAWFRNANTPAEFAGMIEDAKVM